MTINDLGALGSFLAAIAVFITLIYLARQVRQGNVIARYQARQAMIDEGVYQTYHEVVGIFLGTPRTLAWWKGVGRAGMNPEFVSNVDMLLEKRGQTGYWEQVGKFRQQASGGAA